MGGQNPYIEDRNVPRPRGPYSITFTGSDGSQTVVSVDPEKIPYSHHGLPGSILDIGLAHGVDIDHACGGVCACATCHVIIRQGYDHCNEPTDEEEDQLDDAYGLTPYSRLACQCCPTGERDLWVEVPSWNRNRAREAH